MKIVEAHKVKQMVMNYAFFERSHKAVVTEGLRQADVMSITGNKQAFEFEIKVSKSDLNKELAAIRYATMTMKEGKGLAKADTPEQEQLNLELAGLKNKAGGWSKISKHEEYLDPKQYFEKHKNYMMWQGYIPNYYYFVIPNRLVAYAKEKLEGTKYGIIAYDGCRQEGQHYGRFHEGNWYNNDKYPEGAEWKKGYPCMFGGRDTCYQEIAVKKTARVIHSEKVSESIIMDVLNRACTENIRMLEQIVIMEKRLKDVSE